MKLLLVGYALIIVLGAVVSYISRKDYEGADELGTLVLAFSCMFLSLFWTVLFLLLRFL